jgi:3-oxoacyl-[acyl-carrier protein] reductase
MNETDFTGRKVHVVGGSSGIGNGIAQAFRKHGAVVSVWGTRAQAADYDGEEGSDLEGLKYTSVDVSNAANVAAAAPPHAELDVVVLAQGTVLYNRAEFEMPGFERVLGINLASVMTCANKFHDALARASGALIIISSTAAYHATRGNPAYGASKAGVVALTATLAEAWATSGIRVNGIAPGLVDTKLTKVTTNTPERLSRALKSIPLGRIGTPDDIAGVALFLASPLASYVLGQTIIVDGGILLS